MTLHRGGLLKSWKFMDCVRPQVLQYSTVDKTLGSYPNVRLSYVDPIGPKMSLRPTRPEYTTYTEGETNVKPSLTIVDGLGGAGVIVAEILLVPVEFDSTVGVAYGVGQ